MFALIRVCLLRDDLMTKWLLMSSAVRMRPTLQNKTSFETGLHLTVSSSRPYVHSLSGFIRDLFLRVRRP